MTTPDGEFTTPLNEEEIAPTEEEVSTEVFSADESPSSDHVTSFDEDDDPESLVGDDAPEEDGDDE